MAFNIKFLFNPLFMTISLKGHVCVCFEINFTSK